MGGDLSNAQSRVHAYDGLLMFGSHLSIAGGLVNALIKAEELRMDCVQVFTKNQRQWRVTPIKEEEREAWLTKLKELGWHRRSAPTRVVSHNSYLINMASPEKPLWEKSVDLQRIELQRCEALSIPVCVAHPGAHKGEARPAGQPHDLEADFTKAELAGMKRIVKALNRIHRDLPGYRTLTLLETTVGSGSNLGYRFEQLGWIRQNVREPERVGFCLDTCHVTAAGYDMTTKSAASAVLRQFDAVCGLRHIHALHMNDSVGAVGSRLDRHAHIGDGSCGKPCFEAIVNHRSLRRVPKILETPKERNEEGTEWDVVNIRRLKRLIRQPQKRRSVSKA